LSCLFERRCEGFLPKPLTPPTPPVPIFFSRITLAFPPKLGFSAFFFCSAAPPCLNTCLLTLSPTFGVWSSRFFSDERIFPNHFSVLQPAEFLQTFPPTLSGQHVGQGHSSFFAAREPFSLFFLAVSYPFSLHFEYFRVLNLISFPERPCSSPPPPSFRF